MRNLVIVLFALLALLVLSPAHGSVIACADDDCTVVPLELELSTTSTLPDSTCEQCFTFDDNTRVCRPCAKEKE